MPCLSFDEVSQRQPRISWLPARPTTVWAAWQAADAPDKGWSESANAIRGLVVGFHAAGQGYRSCTNYWLSKVAKTWTGNRGTGVRREPPPGSAACSSSCADPPNHCNQITSIFSKNCCQRIVASSVLQTSDIFRHGCIINVSLFMLMIRGLQKRAKTSSRDPRGCTHLSFPKRSCCGYDCRNRLLPAWHRR